jgi:hypothetical protein
MKDTIKSLSDEAQLFIKEIKSTLFLKWLGKRQEPIKYWVVFEE